MSEIKELTARNENIMLDLVFNVRSLQEVCAVYGISMAALRIIRKSPLWKKRERELLDERKHEYELKLDSMVKPAMDSLKEMSAKMISMPVPGSDGKVTTEQANPPAVRMQAVRTILERAQVGVSGEHKPALIQINMYQPPWARKEGEEDKDMMTVTIDPSKEVA